MDNHDRGNYGMAAVRAGTPDFAEDNELGTHVVDTLANVMHLCWQHGIAFTEAVDTATMHYVAEAFGEEGD